MSSLVYRRVLTQATRRHVQRSSANLRSALRRGMASSHGTEKSTDTLWLIGSGAVTALGAAYILSPSSKKHAHESAKAAKVPIERALPKEEEKQSEPELMKDDEGTVEDVSESQKRSFDADSPKDAQAAEEAEARFAEGAPGQTEGGEEAEQKEKPAETKRVGTLQEKPDEGPTDLGDARKEAKEGNAPKEIAEKKES